MATLTGSTHVFELWNYYRHCQHSNGKPRGLRDRRKCSPAIASMTVVPEMADETGNTYIWNYNGRHWNSNDKSGVYDHGELEHELEKSVCKWLRQRRKPEVARLAPKQLYFHFRLSDVIAVAWTHCRRTRNGRKPRICRWNLCFSSGNLNTSGFGGSNAIFGYWS